MPAGRPPKPTKLKLLQGNPGKRALPKNEPAPPSGKVSPPSWLLGRGRKVWWRIAPMLQEMGVLTKADQCSLAMLCEAFADYFEAKEAIEEEGVVYTSHTQSGGTIVRARPEVKMAQDAWMRVHRMMVEFGMTPSARTKVQVTQAEEVDPFEARFG